MLTVICPQDDVLQQRDRDRNLPVRILGERTDLRWIRRACELQPIHHSRILVILSTDDTGINVEWQRMMAVIRRDPEFFRGSVAGVIVDGKTELYTKDLGREVVFTMNQAGCAFPGRPLVEGTGSLNNFRVTAKNLGSTLQEAYEYSVRDLAERVLSAGRENGFGEDRSGESGNREVSASGPLSRRRLLVLHASIRNTSNTWQLWQKVRTHLEEQMEIREISLRNGEIQDCGGCAFTTCLHFSEKGRCFYGGAMVDEVYPAVEECDALLMLCPNYNDAVSANLSAFVNRLTALYRRKPFFDKQIFGIVVSGYSGGDIVAKQLISALNMNKSFRLPAHFCMLETANDPGEILQVEGIHRRAADFADTILRGW